MKSQINLWLIWTCDITIYGNDNVSKFFLRGRCRWYEFKTFFYIYGPHTDTKSDAENNYLSKVHRMLNNLQRKFDFYWGPARDFITNEKIIGFQCRHKDKLWIVLKDAGDGFQADDVCDSGYTYSFIYRNDDIPDSNNYIFATSERVIWL